VRSLVLLLLAAACAAPEPLPRPPEGYSAIRVKEPFVVPGLAVPFRMPAGAMLVADQAVDGRPAYCGMVIMRDVMGDRPWQTCAWFDGLTVQLNVDHGRTAPFPVPPGAIEEFRLR